MALFGLFKNKQERQMDAALETVRKRIFPLGNEDILRDCQRIETLINGKIRGDELRRFVTGCKALIAINGTLGGDPYDDEGFIRSFLMRSHNRITQTEARNMYVYLAGESMYRANMVAMTSGQGQKVPSEMLEYIDQMGKVWERGTIQDKIPSGHGQYGFEATNPIPTVCVAGSNAYLARLRFQNQPVENQRLGSTTSEVISGNIDIYKLNQAGRDVGTIYICPYHRKDSKLAPAGFTLG